MLDDTVSPGRIYSLLWDQWKARVLQSAIKLKVFTRLACRPLTGDELRTALNVRAGPRAAVDFFDALVALGLLLSTDEHYHNSAEASECLDENKPALFVGDAINEFLTLPSVDLTEALLEGPAVTSAKSSTQRSMPPRTG
ncbi:MAG: methyltransferase family protein [Pseudonocardiaceae bacterium]